ncbi:hypothetical protein Back11_30740 [Paenibacillus baekrokdamisoli]|uniref:Uncharacterized protein n=1 Tax=Paenibacillus baekrokdamisoli TaxID=1712516 RepID=A0A3G9JFJ1_9BACL|nr:CAP domain-containing protein [Paenibacillus baekrokdamisoli]MBB3073036.1 putative YkwD family protein [Paenibacillus baekrokdamisoli]BBH21729.1 hypothetical protein Back11_30740 [Paenibacillus baekrokdamisoli]
MKKLLLAACAFVILVGGGSYIYKMNQNAKIKPQASSISTGNKPIHTPQLRMKTTESVTPIVTNDLSQLPPWLQQQLSQTGQITRTTQPSTQPSTQRTTQPVTQAPATNTGTGAGTGAGTSAGSGSIETQVLQLVNAERAKAGLKALTMNASLSKVASTKASDMRDNNYFSHDSPSYGSPFDMMKKFGISFSYAGENIAAGQQDAQAVMTAWMNSPGHRANIMSPNFTEMGLGYSPGGNMSPYWSQMFIQP